MALLYRYGNTDDIYFKLTLNGAAVTGITLLAADVTLSLDGAATSSIGASCAETAGGLGWYKWTPASGTLTECKTGIVNIAATAGNSGYFDENAAPFVTGGDLLSQLNGI